VKRAEQREENEEVSAFSKEHRFIFWNFLKRIPTTVFLHALTVQYALPVTNICCLLVYLSTDRHGSLPDRIARASMYTAQTSSLQRVDRRDMRDCNVTRSRGSFLELLNKSQSRESACVLLLVECSPHTTRSSHMADP